MSADRPLPQFRPKSRQALRLGRPRLLIVGCGDIGLRIVARLRARFRIVGTVTNAESAARVRAAGALPMFLDLDASPLPQRLRRIASDAQLVIVLAPTSSGGTRDLRSRRMSALLAENMRSTGRERGHRCMLYISTTGVYGDRGGAWTSETTLPVPGNARAQRRLDAERRLREGDRHASVLRVPGIYAAQRLPRERFARDIPVPEREHDIVTNHIHAEDLARACIAALARAAPGRVYNVVDDTQLLLGEYLDRVADHLGVAHPRRVSWPELEVQAGELRMSFLRESRRVRNDRMKRELKLKLAYPDVDAGLREIIGTGASAAPQAANKPSTDR